MKSIPVVDLGEGKIDNVITQSAVIHMLAECTGLHWFESWGTKRLSELGLPLMTPDQLVKVRSFLLYNNILTYRSHLMSYSFPKELEAP